MTTEAQINANRQNAQHSTGPKTPGGKARAALNALDHGLRARIIIEDTHAITGERAAPFAALLADLVAQIAPVGVLESHCVETIALSIWRLRLVIRKELDLVAEVDSEDGLDILVPPLGFDGEPIPAPAAVRPLPHPEKLLPLIRYEAHLDRQMRRALALLQQLQATRLAKAALEAPALTDGEDKLGATGQSPVQPEAPASPAPVSSILPNEANSAPASANPVDPVASAPGPSPLSEHHNSAPASALANPVEAAASAPRPLGAAGPVGAQHAAPQPFLPPSRAGKSLRRAEALSGAKRQRGGAGGLGFSPPFALSATSAVNTSRLPNEPNADCHPPRRVLC